MTSEELIERIELALVDNDGSALEAAWYQLYAQDKVHAIKVAHTLRPLARVEVAA